MRRAFREDGDRAATREHATRRVECLPVLCGVGARVLTPVYGDRLEGATEESDHRHPEQRRLGQERDAPGGETQQKRGIDQPARVVQDEDHGTAVGDVLDTRNFDAAEEDTQDQTEQRPEQPPHGDGSPPARPPRQAA